MIFAGDSNGMITVAKIDGGTVTKSSFGAFKDNKNNLFRVLNIFQIEENSIYVLGENGQIRKWALL